MRTLLHICNIRNPQFLVVVLDTGGGNFRDSLYDKYKGNRGPTPESLKPQFAIVREALTAFNINHCQVDGYEADSLGLTVGADKRLASGNTTVGLAASYALTSVDSDRRRKPSNRTQQSLGGKL